MCDAPITAAVFPASKRTFSLGNGGAGAGGE